MIERLYPDVPYPVLPPVKAIKKYCFECGGSCRENQIMCHIMDCPLWPYRLGGIPGGAPYREKMTRGWKLHSYARRELELMGITLEDMLGKPAPSRRSVVPPAQKYWIKKGTNKVPDQKT